MGAFYNIPVLLKGRALGSLNFASHQADIAHFPPAVGATLRSIGRQVASAFARFEKQSEIQQQRRNLLAVFRKLPEMLVVTDTRGIILYANPAIGRMIGCGARALQGRPVEQIHPVERSEDVRRMFRDVVAGRLSKLFLPFLRGDGQIVPVQISVSGGVWSGQPALFGTMHDLSAQRRLETALRESEANFRIMVESARNGFVVLTDENRPPLFANARVAEMTGLTPRALCRRRVSRWLDTGVSSSLTTRVASAMAGRATPNHCDALIMPERGGHLQVELSITRTLWRGMPAVLIAIYDVSWRRKLQRQVVNSVTWERQNMAHFLHDGVAQQITGTAYLCKALEDTLRAAGRPEARQAAQLGSLILDCQQHLRLLSRALLPNPQGDIVANLERLAEFIRVILGKDCMLQHPERLAVLNGSRAGDAYYIVQEAVMNAVRHGKPRSIRFVAPRRGRGRVGFRIADDGAGFVPNHVDSEAFGLHLMRLRAERLGGVLRIKSKVGTGTCVFCDFPAADAP